MTKEKIEELFDNNSSDLFDVDKVEYVKILDIDDFTQAINQAEKEMKLEWYKELEKKLSAINQSPLSMFDLVVYIGKLQNKINELE